jgi:hypothetical protein
MIGLVVVGLIIYGYRALYIKKHGTSVGFFKKAILSVTPTAKAWGLKAFID